MTADTSMYYNDSSFGLQPSYIFPDFVSSPSDSPWSLVSLLPQCNPIQPIMNSPFSVSGFGSGQQKYTRERGSDTHHSPLSPAAPVQQQTFNPNPSNWQPQQNMWPYNSNTQIAAQNAYPSGANYGYGLYNQQWSHSAVQPPYVQTHHPMPRRTTGHSTARYNPYPAHHNSMPTLTRPLYHSPHAVTLSPAVSEIAVPSPSSAQWAIASPLTVSPQLPASSNNLQADDAQEPFRQQQVFFNNATSLSAENWKGPFIPQYIYRPHTNSDRKRYVEEVTLSNPLYFAMDGPHEYGIPLSDALHSRVKRLVDRDLPVFEGRGPSVSIRLEWPGYRPWTRQIPTKDFRSPPCPITMAKLAKAVAKCVQRFIEENKDRDLDEGVDKKWKVGARLHDIKLDDVVLVSLHHVSLGSWQPQLRLRRPRN